MEDGEWRLEGGGWRMEGGRMKKEWRKALERVGSWSMAHFSPPMGALLNHMQVQGGEEWSEVTEGRDCRSCSPLPPRTGSSQLSACNGPEESNAQHQPSQHCWAGPGPSALKGSPGQAGKAPRPVSSAAASLPPAPCWQRSQPSFFGKDSNNSLFRLNTTSPGKEQEPLPQPPSLPGWL